MQLLTILKQKSQILKKICLCQFSLSKLFDNCHFDGWLLQMRVIKLWKNITGEKYANIKKIYITYEPAMQGAVYIQIIRSSKFLCAITEAHDVPMNFKIFQKMSGIIISLTGNQNNVMLFL